MPYSAMEDLAFKAFLLERSEERLLRECKLKDEDAEIAENAKALWIERASGAE